MSTHTALCAESTIAYCTSDVVFVTIVTSFVCAQTLSTRKKIITNFTFVFFRM